MRAGFHDGEIGGQGTPYLYKSQSLVNEGRFPQFFDEVQSLKYFKMSQSLVNEGRFPLKYYLDVGEHKFYY